MGHPGRLHSPMKALRAALLIIGFAVLILLVIRVGTGAIGESLARILWWQFALICLPSLLSMPVEVLGWSYAFTQDRVPFHRLVGARVAGEALNVVTALASVGGEAVKAWLIRRDVRYEDSVPSLIIAKTTNTIAQALFLVAGIAVAWATLSLDSAVLKGMLWLLVVEVLLVGGFLLSQVTGLVAGSGRLLARVGVIRDPSSAQGLDAALRGFYAVEWRRLSLSVGFHFLGWLLGAVETFLILCVLAAPVSLGSATVIEAFGSGVRFAAFLVPAHVGVLEAANAAAFTALGLGATAGVAFSLVKRGRQALWIILGVAMLVIMRANAALAAKRHPRGGRA